MLLGREGPQRQLCLAWWAEIEEALQRNQFALGIFLDIQGAFDNVRFEAILQGMQEKGINQEIISWYQHYLHNRSIEVKYKGVSLTRAPSMGTPQGGVLSPLMWNLAFESLLEGFDSGPVVATGFADDAGLLVTGRSPAQLSRQMQEAVNWALSWGSLKGLTFAPSKTVAVLFTRKRKFDMPPALAMSGVNIQFSETVKYLGVTLDSKLSWKAHIDAKIRAAKGHLLKVNNSLGRLWGLSPKLTRWVYTGIVRPAFTYGCLVWGHACDKKIHQRAYLGLIG